MSTPKSSLGDAAFRRKDLMGSSIEASYAGALSFLRRKYTRNLKGVDVAVTGIPFDQAVTNRPGTRFGPQAIRQASAQHSWGPVWPWRFDPFDTLAVVDCGDCFFDWGRKQDVPRIIEKHIKTIVSRGVCPSYLTFDIDFLDPATAPGTGTPVPGGFSSHQALSVIRAMKRLDFVGMDVVEVSPPYDHAEMTSNAAAMIAAELLCLKAFAAGARAEEMTS